MRVRPDVWVLDSGDNNLAEIKSNILKILHSPRLLKNHVKKLRLYKTL
jgi:hypothetical protein